MATKTLTSQARRTLALPVRLLSLRDAAAYLSLSYWTLRKLVRSGELPSVRVGRRILVDREDIDAWVTEHKEMYE